MQDEIVNPHNVETDNLFVQGESICVPKVVGPILSNRKLSSGRNQKASLRRIVLISRKQYAIDAVIFVFMNIKASFGSTGSAIR